MCPRRREGEPGPTTADTMVERLRARILGGELPPGTPLREQDLADDFGASRHTVRMALGRLTAEGLVQTVAYRGARVAELDDPQLLALQDLRGALESEAVRILRDRHGDHWPAQIRAPIEAAIERLRDAEVQGSWPGIARSHSAVHQALVAAAGSDRITQAYAQLDGEILLLLTHLRLDYPPGSLAIEHRGYLAAVQRDGARAVRAHLAHSTELIRAGRAV